MQASLDASTFQLAPVNLSHTLEIILDEVINSFAISGGGIFLLEKNGTEMKLALHRNIPAQVIEDLAAIGAASAR